MQVTVTWATVQRALLGLLLGVALAGLAWASLRLFGPADPFGGAVDPERYQAVFLSTEQVYFGHLRDAGGDFYELRDAFFIQEVPGEDELEPPTQQVRPVSSEFHEPEDVMLIARDFVVRVENLLPDSEVAQAIDRVRGGGGG